MQIALLVAITGCTHQSTHDSPLLQMFEQSRSKAGIAFASDVQTTDWQAMHIGNDQYGPQLFASYPLLVNPTTIDDFSHGGVIVAVVAVDPQNANSIPAAYGNAGFPNSVNCIYLRHTAGSPDDSGWEWAVQAATSIDACRTDAPSAKWDNAVTREVVSPDGDPAHAYPVDAYPRAIRFEDSKKDDASIVLAVRCGAAVCHLGVKNMQELGGREHIKAPGNVASPRSLIALYFDDQILAVRKGMLGGLKRGTLRAEIVPELGIASLKMSDFTITDLDGAPRQLVARVYLGRDPGSPYGSLGHKGWNEVWLANVKAVPADTLQWFVRIRPVDDNGRPTADFGPRVGVTRHPWKNSTDHGPGTVRWAWLNDEGIWMPCEAGCCEASN